MKQKTHKLTKSQQRLFDDYQKMLKKWESIPKFSSKKYCFSHVIKQDLVLVDTKIKSLVTPGGSTALKEKKVYTGTNVLGISTLHKSNAVPIFSKQEAIEISLMRK